MIVLVTGASRGIGLELTRQLAARGDHVVATARDPSTPALRALAGPRVELLALDVTSDASVAALARALGDRALDALVNNAGVWPDDGQVLGSLDFGELARAYDVNALGPLRVTQALLPHLRRGAGKKVLHVTSGMASIADNTSGGWYGYRMAKAALNMAARSLAIDLRRDRIASAVVDPGWVQTDMGGSGAPTPVADSVRGILARLDELDPRRSGQYLHWQGKAMPW